MYTYQDFEKDRARIGDADAVKKVVTEHRSSDAYQTACAADLYDRQKNKTIMEFVRWLYTDAGGRVEDRYAANHKMASNFFNRLNTQRMTYSLGNGITFEEDGVKEKLGADFDTILRDAGYYALIHGEAFLFYDAGRTLLWKLTEFAPLLDERTGAITAGVRFWQLSTDKPLIAVLYETDGFTRYESNKTGKLTVTEQKRAYRERIVTTAADKAAGIAPEIYADNYGGKLPIVPLWGSRLHQSTIVGMRPKIDGYDLIQSGFANDLSDCAEIYWLISGAGGMNDKDLARFRERLKLQKIASVPNADDVSVSAHTQEIPYQARAVMLEKLKASIYEDFGGLDVHTVSAGATNDHIDAAYQPMDENADDYEYQIITAVLRLEELAGVESSVPQFKRNRISNMRERAEIVMMFAQYLPDDIIISNMPLLDADGVKRAQEERAAESIRRVIPDDEDVM